MNWTELTGNTFVRYTSGYITSTSHTASQDKNQATKSKKLSVDQHKNILWWGTDQDKIIKHFWDDWNHHDPLELTVQPNWVNRWETTIGEEADHELWSQKSTWRKPGPDLMRPEAIVKCSEWNAGVTSG